jgi:hypothetical protein
MLPKVRNQKGGGAPYIYLYTFLGWSDLGFGLFSSPTLLSCLFWFFALAAFGCSAAVAANAQRFNELYAAVTDVFVPKVYSDLTTRKVLVMEWVDGFRLTDSESLAQYNLDRRKLVDTLVQCSLRQILENGETISIYPLR